MLQPIGIYLLKSLIVSAVFLLYYWFTLRNKRFHYYNRFYLLSAVILSIALPLLNLNLFTLSSNNDKAINLFNVIYASGEDEISFAVKTAALDWQQLLFVLVLTITSILLLKLLFRIIAIYRIKKKYPVSSIEEFDFINTDLQQAPFSFLKNIFWRNDISIEERTGRLILQHELAHIKEKHTLDKLFMQIVVALLWANPLYRLYQKELYLIHEFIADDKSVTDNDTAAFAEMLLHAHYGKFNFDPAQPFFYSPIKRRLIMLTTSKEPRFSYVRRIMALPLIALTVLLFAFRLQKENTSENVTLLKPGTTFTLVLDAGHGGEDGGALAPDGTKEKDLTLAISKKVRSLSSEYGVDVVMTRTEDVFMSPKEKADFSNKQKADAFVSIHVNATEKDQLNKSGMEIVISKNNDNKQLDKSKILGSALIQNLNENFTTTQALLQHKVGIWVLQATTVPAVLVECGYLSNSRDLSLLKDDAQIELMARKILEGVVAYANNNNAPVNPYDVKMQDDNAMADTSKPKDNVKRNVTTIPSDVVYVLNGEITTKETVDKLDPNNIASIQVLKDDEFAKSIYNIKGKQAVLVITTKDYKPKTVTSIKTPTENVPLYIVDGTSMSTEEAKKIEPDDILSVNVLKGDDATKAYGDKAKNGVVEITTKNAARKGNGIIINTGFEAQKILLLGKPKQKC
jgi:N-acetylmuramoyl-L-alanine amidase